MKRIYMFVFAILVSTLLIGCGAEDKTSGNLADDSNQVIEFEIIASAKALPSNFNDLAFERKETPFFQYLVKKVENHSEYGDIWSLYEFENAKPNVDFNKKAVVFVGVHESGSCPYKINNVELNSGKTISVSLFEPDGACDASATPRTFVLKIDKEVSKEIKKVSIVQSGVETVIPFE
ncbi:hypothetical protein [Sporosarcina highlanderae]|uniref:Lipoprotein n=1 Tax=Sporosarcina highlanderae TaxID=3035916 RepID=A0ABT8JPG3_9BACL|nr:hypothetical protein [Sporosarcina highlanderae]MDN4607025.1 hypothetical protein [Sporosarcina highlanderae]